MRLRSICKIALIVLTPLASAGMILITPAYSAESAISQAVKLREQTERVERYAKTLWLYPAFHAPSDTAFEEFVLRVMQTPDLENAIKQAREKEVITMVSTFFDIGEGKVQVNADASDKEIIDFLLGTPEE